MLPCRNNLPMVLSKRSPNLLSQAPKSKCCSFIAPFFEQAESNISQIQTYFSLSRRLPHSMFIYIFRGFHSSAKACWRQQWQSATLHSLNQSTSIIAPTTRQKLVPGTFCVNILPVSLHASDSPRCMSLDQNSQMTDWTARRCPSTAKGTDLTNLAPVSFIRFKTCSFHSTYTHTHKRTGTDIYVCSLSLTHTHTVLWNCSARSRCAPEWRLPGH